MTEFLGSHQEKKPVTSPVIDRLQSFTHDVVGPLLDAKLQEAHAVDPSAGIVIVGLPGEIETDKGIYHFHGARVLTGADNFVKPHYHKIGIEPYHILSGDDGEMNLGRVVDGEVKWDEPKLIRAGGLVVVQEGQVHSLRNTGKEPLDFTFACPDNHVKDNGPDNPKGDRYFTSDLIHGTPPWYDQK